MTRAVAGGCALGLATGWNVSNTGAVAEPLAAAYGIDLATVGLFTTALFLTHLAMQIPGGKASDRFGARRSGLAGLAVIAVFNAIALAAPEPALGVAARAAIGVGTGFAFVAGSAYVRAAGGSAFAQGLFGGVGLGGGGLALAVVPHVEDWVDWRAPFATALTVAAVAGILLAAGPRDTPAAATRAEAPVGSVLSDARLYRLAVLYAASLGLSVMIGNWVVTLLDRHGGLGKGAAGGIGALTLALGVITRPFGGWLLHAHPHRVRAALCLSAVAGTVGTAALAAAHPPVLAAAGAALVGLAAGIPFAPAFTGAAGLRPDAPAASVGLVNGAASLVIVAGTPLLGLTFSLPGDGRLGFLVVAALWAASLLALPSGCELGATSTAAPESQ